MTQERPPLTKEEEQEIVNREIQKMIQSGELVAKKNRYIKKRENRENTAYLLLIIGVIIIIGLYVPFLQYERSIASIKSQCDIAILKLFLGYSSSTCHTYTTLYILGLIIGLFLTTIGMYLLAKK